MCQAQSSQYIGTTQAVKDKADGYTLILVTSTTQAITPHLYQKRGFDVAKRSASWHALPPGRFSRS